MAKSRWPHMFLAAAILAVWGCDRGGSTAPPGAPSSHPPASTAPEEPAPESQESPPEPSMGDLLRQLARTAREPGAEALSDPDTIRARHAAAQALQTQFRLLESTLIQIASTEFADDPFSRSPASYAIYLLGRIASPRALQFLVENVEIHDFLMVDDDGENYFSGGYRCAQALADAGVWAFDFIGARLQSSPPSSVSDRAISLYALVLSYGWSRDEAVARTQGWRDTAPQDHQHNFNRLIEMEEALERDRRQFLRELHTRPPR